MWIKADSIDKEGEQRLMLDVNKSWWIRWRRWVKADEVGDQNEEGELNDVGCEQRQMK